MRQLATLFFLGFLGIGAMTTQAQVIENIKRESSNANSNKSEKSSSSSSGTNSFNSSGGDDWASCCTDIACDLACSLFGSLINGGFENNIGIIEQKKEEVPRIASIDVEIQASLVPDNYFIAQPRIRLNGGWVSTDFRYFYMLEERLIGSDTYGTLDWQILKFNFLNIPLNTSGVGGGFMHETIDGGGTYPEFSIYTDFYFADKWRIGAEGRWASSDAVARSEVNGSVRYTIASGDHFEWHGFLGGNYAKYYRSVEVWSVNVGTSFRIQ